MDVLGKQEKLKGWYTLKTDHEKNREGRNCLKLQNLKKNTWSYDFFLLLLKIQSKKFKQSIFKI